MDTRNFKQKRIQIWHDWASPMWLVVLACAICQFFGPLVRSDFAMSADGIRSGHFVTLFSAIFMHGNEFHLVSNMVMLIILSVILDSIPVSRYITMFLFFGGGILCNLLVLPLIFHTPMLVMGSSGGIATLEGIALTVLLTLGLKRKKTLVIDSNHIYSLYGWKLLVTMSFLLVLLDPNLYQISPDTFFLHLFGLVFGVICGLVIDHQLEI